MKHVTIDDETAIVAKISVCPTLLFALLDEISRVRALKEQETDLLEIIVHRGHRSRGIRMKWTPAMDGALARAARMLGGVNRFAETNNVTPMACYKRMSKLQAAKDGRKGVTECGKAVQGSRIQRRAREQRSSGSVGRNDNRASRAETE